MVFLHEGVAIIPLKIVGQHRQGTSGLFCQVIEPCGELLEAGLALETKGVILHFRFGHHQVGVVLSVLLLTFDVEEDVEGLWGGVLVLGWWWCHLDEAAVGLNVHHLLTGRTWGIPTVVFLPLLSPPQQFETPRTFLAALADRSASGSGRFAIVGEAQVVGQTGGAVEEMATGWAGHGGGLVVGVGLQVIRAPILQTTATMGWVVGAGMLTGIIVGLVTLGTEIGLAKEARQTGQGVVMAVFVQDPQELGTTAINETRVGLIGIYYHQRVFGQGQGELVQFVGATRSRMDLRGLVELDGRLQLDLQPSLEGSPLRVIFRFGPDGNNGSSTAEIRVCLGDGHHALFNDFQTGGGLMAWQVFALVSVVVGAGTYMDKRQVEGVVHLEVFDGVEHAAQILQQACHASLVATPFPSGQTPTVISVA